MSSIPSNEQIEIRAYEIYIERGGDDGHDVEDWLAAEQQLLEKHRAAEALFAQVAEGEARKQAPYHEYAAAGRNS